jgi:Ca2+/Na+ antiporter
MLGLVLLLFPLMFLFSQKRIGRIEGFVLFVLYLVYIFFLF